jgi:glucuronate isomerase
MKPFIHDDFLLESPQAVELYHCHAAHQPILDYHNHLPPAQIAENHQFSDLFEIWLAGDHYKWRAMRTNGVDERLCTGSASSREKYDAWVATVPHTLRNPLYHWSHLEVSRYFGFDSLIQPSSANQLWSEAGAQLPHLRVHDILRKFNVAALCTTDDPADPLTHHEAIRKLNQNGTLKTRVYPTYRPDKALLVNDPSAFNPWLDRLAATTGIPVASFENLLTALRQRHEDFHAIGGRLSDHGLEQCPAAPCTPEEAARIFLAARDGKAASAAEHLAYASYLMKQFGRWDAAKGWTKQLHLGAQRNNNSRLLRALGPDTGFDSISDLPQTRSLSAYLDSLDSTGELPRTILYNLNPADNYAFATMIGNFQDGTVPGKIQFGSGWWFLDQLEGMEWQLNALSNLGLLSRFVGMLTDSRSFLSFPRHEYFRRLLCNLLGNDMRKGKLPDDPALIGGLVESICFRNARDYLRLELAD